MKIHTKTYMHHFDYGEQDIILCEACGARAVDIHHIDNNRQNNNIKNLIALCRRHHNMAHSSKRYVSKSEFQFIHNNFLQGNRTQFLK